jgi:hypothetical protein
MDHLHDSRPPRSIRRQAILVCAYGAYLGFFGAGAFGLASLVATTGLIATVLATGATAALTTAGVLWAIDAHASRRRPMARVTPLRPRTITVVHGRRRHTG